MKPIIKIVVAVLVMLTAATAVAMASALPDPTTPYPSVPPNADVCKVEKIDIEKAQVGYEIATRQLDRVNQGSAQEVRDAERAALLASVELNTAQYAEAVCRNQNGDDPNKGCIALALDLNRWIDQLADDQELVRVARENYEAMVVASPPPSEDDLDRAQTSMQIAGLDRQESDQRVIDQRERIAADSVCHDFPSTRPPA
jgi:hypothetical protein